MEELAPAGAAVTEDDWTAARSRNRRIAYLSCVVGVIVGPLIGILNSDDQLLVKERSLTANWNNEHKDVLIISLAG